MVAHLQFFQPHKAEQKQQKSQQANAPNRHEMTSNQHDRKKGEVLANIGFATWQLEYFYEIFVRGLTSEILLNTYAKNSPLRHPQ